MRKLSLITASAALAVLPLFSAKADDGAKVYYKDGTNIETSDLELKIKFELQTNFSFISVERLPDTTGFDVTKARIAFSGNLLDKQFSFKIENDVAADTGGGALKDAWFQYNSDDANVKLGQFKVPFSRQETANSGQLEFTETSFVTRIFAPSRQVGAQVNGSTGDINYAVGTYNGYTDGEGPSTGPTDNTLAYYAAVNASTEGYGSRSYEGDLRENNSSTDFTGGAAVIYGDSTTEAIGDYSHFDLNVDLGARSGGLSAQADFYYSTIDIDDVPGDAGTLDAFGFYTQAGYMLDKNWEVAGRFGYFAPDEDVSIIDSTNEYSLVLNYYLKGHSLKLQNQVTFIDVKANKDLTDEEDASAFKYEAQLAGLF